MKRRFSSHVTLMELTAALLIFMLASVTILGLFTAAYQRSENARRLTKAMIIAQDLSAQLVAAPDMEQMLLSQGFRRAEDGFWLEVGDGIAVCASVRLEQTEVGQLLGGSLNVCMEDEVIFELPVSRYYNKEVIRP